MVTTDDGIFTSLTFLKMSLCFFLTKLLFPKDLRGSWFDKISSVHMELHVTQFRFQTKRQLMYIPFPINQFAISIMANNMGSLGNLKSKKAIK